MNVLTAIGGLGGAIAFIGAVVILARSIFEQVSATKANTVALNKLADKYEDQDGQIARLKADVSVLMDRTGGARGGSAAP